ncbi:DNA repair protein REV1 isoform X2 [Malania oleifera]|uniref:DNA repair protein REV1 isoform X2 n=1 Tax=Malania oleifera TaxID=397392 RepID=UPI0025AE82C8|nr:DNA repair protein REV1 isoform X2 [Malania oleifera]
MSFNSSRSANSGGKSKRSFGSASSAPSNNSNGSNGDNNKKRNTNQKTLGMAWGASSRSSSRSSFNNSPFSDFGSYMVVKNQKLQAQFDAEASSSSRSGSTSEKPIFQGVSIFVDGFTVPSSQELRGYMLKFGGCFENYFSKHRVTHIVCSNLPDSKIKNLRSFSGGLPVVKPTWVLDCVAANKLLNWVPYQLDQLASETRSQPKLSAFFSMKSSLNMGDAATLCQVNDKTGDSTFKGGTLGDTIPFEADELIECTGQSIGKVDDLMQENTNVELKEETTCCYGKSCEAKIAESQHIDTVDEFSVKIGIQASSCGPSTSVNSCCLGNQSSEGLTCSTAGISNPRHSSLGNLNFVENYFKNSRLHFIGTWRNRYRKRFPSLSNGFKSTNSNLDASVNSRNIAIIHVDMDCFFVSVVIRNRPDLRDMPVAVCHSDNPRGTAEISSANYLARDYGVRAGIFVRDAKALCPHLVIVPYHFEAYEEVADQFYDILHKHCSKVQAVSCDEAFLEATISEKQDPGLLASIIRKEIFDTTGCSASAGIAGNMLMARLATRTAKPDGQCYIPPEKVDDHLCQLPIKALPGIGRVLEEKLKKLQLETCGQLRMISKESLQKDFGAKTSDMLWNYCRGIDNRLVGVFQESKSVGAEVNWGVRFNDLEDTRRFISNLCKEVSLRLQGCEVQGRTFTLKIKKRKKDAQEPAKFMGCGDCENLSHSMTVPVATDDVDVLQRIARQLFGFFHIDAKDIRGIGLQVSKLESADSVKQGQEKNSLRAWLASASAAGAERKHKNYDLPKERSNIDCEQFVDKKSGNLCGDSLGKSVLIGNSLFTGEAFSNQISGLPPLCHLDRGVVGSLPPELFSEINELYGGKLRDLIAKNKGKNEDINDSVRHERVEVGGIDEGIIPHSLFSPLSHSQERKKHKGEEVVEVSASKAGGSDVVSPLSGLQNVDLMPSSLSQVDASVLQQLPEELKVDILKVLPAHRKSECSSKVVLDPVTEYSHESFGIKNPENDARSMNSGLNNNLWMGNPPLWVENFKTCKCLTLNIFAKIYNRLGSPRCFSSILQCAISDLQLPDDASYDGTDESICSLCELIKQYIEMKLESDIEEIYICFRLLKRFTMRSNFFSQVYNMVFPYVQVCLGLKSLALNCTEDLAYFS